MVLRQELRDILTLIADLADNNIDTSMYDTAIIERRRQIPAEETRNHLNELNSLGFIKILQPTSGVVFRLLNITREGLRELADQDLR